MNVIAHIELAGGVWYPRGGVYAIARALHRAAEGLGVEVHTNTPVERCELRHGQVRGVTLADGRTLAASAVISNVDVFTTYARLLPADAPGAVAMRRRLAGQEPSCSGFMLLLGLTRQHPQLAHHTILFSADYRREFAEIFGAGRPPADPTIYLAITSKSDPSHAPPGGENWFVLVNAPPLGRGWDWAAQAGAYRDLVLERLAARGLDVRDAIAVERCVTPLDLQRMSGAWRGALYGISSNSRLAAFRRPHNRARGVRGLYFAGGTTHPGGGVPLVVLSGRVAARLLLRDML